MDALEISSTGSVQLKAGNADPARVTVVETSAVVEKLTVPEDPAVTLGFGFEGVKSTVMALLVVGMVAEPVKVSLIEVGVALVTEIELVAETAMDLPPSPRAMAAPTNEDGTLSTTLSP
jgi:hypothetical protein